MANNYKNLSHDELLKLIEKLTKLINHLLKLYSQNNNKTFLDNQEFIQYMNISKRTAQNWRNENKIPFSKISRKYYYLISDIKAFLQQHRISPENKD